MWTFYIYNQDESLRWEIPYTRMTITEELNKGLDGSLSMSFSAFDRYAKAFQSTVDGVLSSGFRSWKLFRDGNIFRRGVLSHRTIEGGATGASTIVLYFTDYIGLLAARNTADYKFYDLVDSSDIAWDLINEAQTEPNGDMGITRGLDPTTVNRQRTFVYNKIRDEITKMSNANQSNGYDFDIDNTLKFNVYYPQKGNWRPEIVFSSFNIDAYSLNMPLTAKLANRINVVGEGYGEDMVTATVQDTTPQTTWGLLEAQVSEKSVGREVELQNRGNRELEKRKYPVNTLNITTKDFSPEVTSYDIGDSVKIQLSEIGFEEMRRIETRTLDILPSGQAIVDLTFFEYEATE